MKLLCVLAHVCVCVCIHVWVSVQTNDDWLSESEAQTDLINNVNENDLRENEQKKDCMKPNENKWFSHRGMSLNNISFDTHEWLHAWKQTGVQSAAFAGDMNTHALFTSHITCGITADGVITGLNV